MLENAEALLAAIIEMADAEKIDIAEKADNEVAKINKQAKVEIERLKSEAMAQLEERLCAESETIVNAAKRDIKNKLVLEKNKALEKVFVLAKQNIRKSSDEIRKDFLKRLITDAIDRANSDDVRLRISNDDLGIWKSIKKNFPKSISVETFDGPIGTVIVETSDGSLSIDNSIDTRLEIARNAMRAELCDILFANDKPGETTK